MSDLPQRLQDTLELLEMIPDRADRIQMLIDIADRYREVPPEVAQRPFPEEHRVPACESEAFVWVCEQPDGTLELHFAVDNPQGISAMALAAILEESLAGEPPARVAAVPQEIVYRIFGRELSMGKSMGLMGMVAMVTAAARRLADPGHSASAVKG